MNSLSAALIGQGISQSLSPELHRAAGRSVGITVEYDLVDVSPEHLPKSQSRLADAGLSGWNVTAPYKRAVHDWVHQMSPLAERLGAVNTVVVGADGSMLGHNTDVAGFELLLDAWKGDRAIVLGAGGAAAAAVDVLANRTTHLEIVNRSLERANSLRARLAPNALIHPITDLSRILHDADLLVNAIGSGIQALLPALDLGSLARNGLILDLSYGAQAHALVTAASHANREARDGLDMLIGQGIASFELWTGLRPDLDSVRSALR